MSQYQQFVSSGNDLSMDMKMKCCEFRNFCFRLISSSCNLVGSNNIANNELIINKLTELINDFRKSNESVEIFLAYLKFNISIGRQLVYMFPYYAICNEENITTDKWIDCFRSYNFKGVTNVDTILESYHSPLVKSASKI
jgi:hypothetical protein